jgi:hypothetical protein
MYDWVHILGPSFLPSESIFLSSESSSPLPPTLLAPSPSLGKMVGLELSGSRIGMENGGIGSWYQDGQNGYIMCFLKGICPRDNNKVFIILLHVYNRCLFFMLELYYRK